jgi:TIR domain/Pentapeptide repeats (8 copies)
VLGAQPRNKAVSKMANEEHLRILRHGSDNWNKWRAGNPTIKPDLADAHLSGATLVGFDLFLTDLSGAFLRGANLSDSDLSYASLVEADLDHANFRGANLYYTNLYGAKLQVANFDRAEIAWTIFGDNDLSSVSGLDSVHQKGPSTIGIDTIYQSGGNIPDSFLRGAGVPDEFIVYAHSLVGKSINFYSCFISYSHKDEAFSKRLYSRLRESNIRVWFAPEDIKGGQKLYDQIDHAIHLHDKLLIVLSNESMRSEWVVTEIRKAKKAEADENRRKLFPIRLVDFETIKAWECFDADNGKDLAVEVREYFIPDFSKWKDYDEFENAFERLLRDLKAGDTVPGRT